MSQFGMQMPGAQRSRRAGLNIYTGMLACAVLFLAAAVAIVWIQGSKIAPADAGPVAPLSVHEEGRVRIP